VTCPGFHFGGINLTQITGIYLPGRERVALAVLSLWDTMHGNFEGVNPFIAPLGTPLVPCPIQHCRWDAHLPCLGVWAHRWIYNRTCDPWPLRHQTYDYLPSQRPLLLQPLGWRHSHPGRSGEDKRLSSLSGWLHTKTVYTRRVTHLSNSQVWRRVTLLLRSTPLPICHTATHISRGHRKMFAGFLWYCFINASTTWGTCKWLHEDDTSIDNRSHIGKEARVKKTLFRLT